MWEEILVLLPSWTQLILLSATVPNVVDFASWVGRIKRKKIHVITTDRDPYHSPSTHMQREDLHILGPGHTHTVTHSTPTEVGCEVSGFSLCCVSSSSLSEWSLSVRRV